MKIALLISGLSRDYQRVYSSIMKNIVEPTKADIFIATWHEANTFDYLNMYRPKSFLVEDFNLYKERFEALANKLKQNCRPEINPINVISWWHCMRVGFSLISSNYDVVIKYRTELTHKQQLTEEEISLFSHNLCIPRLHDSPSLGGICDLWAAGPFLAMKSYCYLDYVYESIFDREKLIFHPESYLHHYLTKCKINPVRFDFQTSLRGKDWNY